MVFLLILLGILLSVLGLFLFTPLIIHIDSCDNQYQVKWGRGLIFEVVPVKEDLLFRLKVFFWKKDWSIFKIQPSKKSDDKKSESKPKKKSKTSFKKVKWAAKSVGGALKIKAFKLNLDTDDPIVNAYLFPIFYFLNLKKGQWQINYEGKLEFQFWVVSKPIWVLQKMIKYRNDL